MPTQVANEAKYSSSLAHFEPYVLRNMDANFHAASPSPERELQDLLGQIAQARCALADLKRQIAAAHRKINFDARAHLVEINEQLIVSAMRHQTNAEQAAQAFGELSRTYAMDTLTQLPNRMLLKDRFLHAIASAQRQRNRMAILFIDINDFKGINDTLGHAVGDEVLKHAAQGIAHSVRDVDFVCRYGGDEFVVLVTDVAQASDAQLVLQKIVSAVASPFRVENTTISVSLSVGVAIYPEDGVEAETLIRRADAAMYESKRLKKLTSSAAPQLPAARTFFA